MKRREFYQKRTKRQKTKLFYRFANTRRLPFVCCLFNNDFDTIRSIQAVNSIKKIAFHLPFFV
jgi:hypothetical protein